MDDKPQIERLEQELRFLKESFEAEVISKEEYEKGKDRVEKKMREIGMQKGTETESEATQEEKPAAEEEKIKLQVVDVKESAEKSELPEETKEYEVKKDDNKIFKYAVVFVVLALAVFFSYSLLKTEDKELTAQKPMEDIKFVEIGKITYTNIIVLNDKKNCFNCDTQRVLGILEGWFGRLNAKEVDHNTEEGKILAEAVEARLLPAYILDDNITQKPSFEQFRQAFAKKDDYYVLSENAAGSTFYFKREEIPNKLDFFVIENDPTSTKAENNLKEFLDVFKDIKFEKHLSTGALAKELDIKSFPAFLVNNRVKFSGIHSAETIKNNFCRLNKLEECKKNLSKSLV